jgi:crossover junction endonuclease MUS81
MQVSIIIDNRETKLYSSLMERDLDVYKEKVIIEKAQLDIGDIHIKFNDIIYVYERKTVNDLLSSIKDGRYKEQKHRLLSSGVATINYIIEGDTITSHKNFNNQKLLTSIYYNSTYRDKINVFFTSNVDDTSTFILLLATKIIDKPENFICSSSDNNHDYIDVCKIKTKKCANIDKDTCYLLQLSQIPTISKEIAKKIKEVYPTMPVLIQTLESKSDLKEKTKLLSSIDGIGNKKAAIIIEYLS